MKSGAVQVRLSLIIGIRLRFLLFVAFERFFTLVNCLAIAVRRPLDLLRIEQRKEDRQ